MTQRIRPTVVWFNLDLRLADQPALQAASIEESPILPCYVIDLAAGWDWNPGSASRWWLYHSLRSLDRQFQKFGGRLIVKKGDVVETLLWLLDVSRARSIHWTTGHDPKLKKDSALLKLKLDSLDVQSYEHMDGLMFPSSLIRTQQGQPYKMYSAFAKACQAAGPVDLPNSIPQNFKLYNGALSDDANSNLELLVKAEGGSHRSLNKYWQPGERHAVAKLQNFSNSHLVDYSDNRDEVAADLTSRLSPHIHFGEVSIRKVWYLTSSTQASFSNIEINAYQRQLLWREFCYHLLVHWPTLPSQELRKEYCNFPWKPSRVLYAAWKRGETGYPFVDAALRELSSSGWIHNRARMVAASFLVKQLLVPWKMGQSWFWRSLVDADLANNAASWQWVSGCGTDSAPYYRIFNPVLQGQKFDPVGDYVRRWIPELRTLPNRWIHEPWRCPAEEASAAGFRLGCDYPYPIIDLGAARTKALQAWQSIRS